MESNSGRTFSGVLKGNYDNVVIDKHIGRYAQFFAENGVYNEIRGIRFDGPGGCRGAYNMRQIGSLAIH